MRNREESIDKVDTFLTENGIDSEERTRHKLLLGKILTEYSKLNEEAPFRIITQRYYKRVVIVIDIKCDRYNLLEDADTLIGEELLNNMANPPKWYYRFGWNRLR